MALVKCSECGKEISSNASECPNCGNPIASADYGMMKGMSRFSRKRLLKNGIALFMLVVSLVALTACGGSSSRSYSNKSNSLKEAEDWVKDNYNVGSDGYLYNK